MRGLLENSPSVNRWGTVPRAWLLREVPDFNERAVAFNGAPNFDSDLADLLGTGQAFASKSRVRGRDPSARSLTVISLRSKL